MAKAPEAVLVPLRTEHDRLEAAARVARPIGQRLDAARSAMRKADARAAVALSALAAATEKDAKAVGQQTTCAAELAALGEELRASARNGQVDDLAEAVEAALKNPAAAYSHATLQAAFARYGENKKDKNKVKDKRDSEAPSPGLGKAAAKAVRIPGMRRSPAHQLSAAEACAVVSVANAVLTLSLANGLAMEEDGQGGEMEEEDAYGAKKLEAPPRWRPWPRGLVDGGGLGAPPAPSAGGGAYPLRRGPRFV